MCTEHKDLLAELRKAWLYAGPRPDIHNMQKYALFMQWPSLFNAINKLCK